MFQFPQQGQRRQIPLAARFLPVIIGIGGVMVFLMTNCEKGPFGRNRVVALKPEEEMVLGEQAFKQALQQEQVLDPQRVRLTREESELVDVVNQITGRLVKAAREPEVLQHFQLTEDQYEWEVEVVRSDTPNAFCLPGGKMVVYTGIIPIAQTEAALATVIGHEIAHALGRHGAERMALDQVQQLAAAAAAGLGETPEQQRAVMIAFGLGGKFGIALPFSRSHESEADRMGLVLMATAGYNPEESVRFWERMGRVAGTGQKPPEYMSTHPSDQTRIAQLTELMPNAMEFYKSSPQYPTRYLPGVRPERALNQQPNQGVKALVAIKNPFVSRDIRQFQPFLAP